MSFEATVTQSEGVLIEVPCPKCGTWLEPVASCSLPDPVDAWCGTCEDWAFFADCEYVDGWDEAKPHNVLKIRGPFRVSVLEER